MSGSAEVPGSDYGSGEPSAGDEQRLGLHADRVLEIGEYLALAIRLDRTIRADR